MSDLPSLPTADPAAMTLAELARLYEDLLPKCETAYRSSVRGELERRLNLPGADGFVDAASWRFWVDDDGDLHKSPVVPKQRTIHRAPKPAKRGRPRKPPEPQAVVMAGRRGEHKIAATDIQ